MVEIDQKAEAAEMHHHALRDAERLKHIGIDVMAWRLKVVEVKGLPIEEFVLLQWEKEKFNVD